MSASSYYNDQHQPGRLDTAYQGQQQSYHSLPGEQYQGPPLPPPPRSSSASPYPFPPQDPGYGQAGYSHNYAGYEHQQQSQGPPYPPRGHEYNNSDAATGYGLKNGSAQEYYSDSSPYSEHERQQQQYPAAPPQIAQIQVEGDTSDPAAAEGERGLGGGLLGGVAGLVAGHQVNHGLLGAVGGGIAGSLLQDRFKKHGKHEHEYQQEHEYEHGHRHRHRHGHHHHHSHSHSRHRSVSRNGGGSGSESFSDDDSRRHRHGY